METFKIQFARFYAFIKHGSAVYVSGVPYVTHLKSVETKISVLPFENLEDVICAAWVNRVINDAATDVKNVTELFGQNVSKIVSDVTDNRMYDGRDNTEATAIKLVNRLVAVANNPSLMNVYKAEYIRLKSSLYTVSINEILWQELKTTLAIPPGV